MPLGSFHWRFKLATARNEIFRACGTDPWWKSLYCITWNNFPTYRGRARINSEIVRITGGRDRVWLKSGDDPGTLRCAFFDCRSNFEPSTLFFVLVITVGASLREHTTRWRRANVFPTRVTFRPMRINFSKVWDYTRWIVWMGKWKEFPMEIFERCLRYEYTRE